MAFPMVNVFVPRLRGFVTFRARRRERNRKTRKTALRRRRGRRHEKRVDGPPPGYFRIFVSTSWYCWPTGIFSPRAGQENPAALGPGLGFPHLLEVDDPGAVDAQEALRIELGFDGRRACCAGGGSRVRSGGGRSCRSPRGSGSRRSAPGGSVRGPARRGAAAPTAGARASRASPGCADRVRPGSACRRSSRTRSSDSENRSGSIGFVR